MFQITNNNFNEQVEAIANGAKVGTIIDFNLKFPLSAEQLAALERALKQNAEKQWGFHISREMALDVRVQLLQSLPNLCSQISYLQVNSPPLTERDIAALENIITANKSPLHLQIVLDKTFPTNGFLNFLKNIQSSQTLTQLGIYNSLLSNTETVQLISAVARFIKNNTSLHELDFYDIELNESGTKLIIEALTHNYSIQQIFTTEVVEPVEELLARNRALSPIFQYLKDDLDKNNIYPVPKSFHKYVTLLTDDERTVLIHQLERSKHNLAPMACAYLLFPETSFYNLIASYIDASAPEDEARSHAAITFLLQASSNPQFKVLAETLLYHFKVGSPFESVKNRLSTVFLHPDEQYIKMNLSSGDLMDDRIPTAMPAIPVGPVGFFSQNRNTARDNAADDAEENDQSYESTSPGS